MDSQNIVKQKIPCLQLQKKSKINSLKDLARFIAPKAVQVIYNAMRIGPKLILRSAFELLKANLITRILSAIAVIAIDTIDLFFKRVSFKQYVINVLLAVMLLLGGTAGWTLGGRIAYLIIIENIILTLFLSLVGAGVLGIIFTKSCEKIISFFIKSDTYDMLYIFNINFNNVISKCSLNEEEVIKVQNKCIVTNKMIKEIFVHKNRDAYATNIIMKHVQDIRNNNQ